MFTLVLGGARSGKSRYAQSFCVTGADVLYVATAVAGDDAEMEERIRRHRADRPATWATVEEPLAVEVAIATAPPGATILLDCVTVWLSNLMWEHRGLQSPNLEAVVLGRIRALAAAARGRDLVAVSNEVGWGLVPESPVGRAFRDLQGLANQELAREADRVVLTVAGLPLLLKGGPLV